MGTNCLILCGVVLLVADDQRSYFMTNVNLPHVGGTSVLRPRLVFPLSAACYACCIPILREFRFPHLAVCLLRGGTRLSVVRGLLRSLYLNMLGVPIPILIRGNPLQNPSCYFQLRRLCWIFLGGQERLILSGLYDKTKLEDLFLNH